MPRLEHGEVWNPLVGQHHFISRFFFQAAKTSEIRMLSEYLGFSEDRMFIGCLACTNSLTTACPGPGYFSVAEVDEILPTL